MTRGYFITFEGIDQCGKSTQVERLIRRLTSDGYVVECGRDPGSTSVSEQIRNILLSAHNANIGAITELLLYEAARAQLVHEKIRPALNEGKIVIMDRFYDSTTAYQGYGRNIDLQIIHQANHIASGGLTPDLTFYLDIDWEESTRRKGQSERDRMENQSRAFFDKVRTGYLKLVQSESHRFIHINGTAELSVIEAQIWDTVRSRLSDTENRLVKISR